MARNHRTRFHRRSLGSKRIRQVLLELLEDRRLLAVASLPDHRLNVSQPSAVLGYGNFHGGDADLVSVSRSGRIDVAINGGANGWQATSSFDSGIEGVLGGMSGLLNADVYDDLILLAPNDLTVLRSDGRAGWKTVQTLPHLEIVAAETYSSLQTAVAFLGNDMALDFVAPLGSLNQLAVFRGDHTGTFSTPIYVNSGAANPLSVASADVIGGPAQDIIVGHRDGTLTFLEGDALGAMTLRSDLTRQLGLGAIVSVRASDLRQDGSLDIVVAGERGVQILSGAASPALEPVLANGDFSAGLAGWTSEAFGAPVGMEAGRVNAFSGFAQFTENTSFLTSLSQSFIVPENPHTLEFDILAMGLESVNLGAVPDAFEVSLLDGNAQSLVDTHSLYSTAFVNFVSGEAISAAGNVSIAGTRIKLDISELEPGANALLVFDLIGHPAGTQSTAMIDNVLVTPALAREDTFAATAMSGPFVALADLSIADVDGDGLLDIVATDGGAQSVIVYNADRSGSWTREPIGMTQFGSPARLVLAPFTATDPIFDIAVTLSGQAALVSPLVADTALPTARLILPESGSEIRLGATQSAMESLGHITLQFSEAMAAASTTAAGSATNPASYKLYNYGPNGIDEQGLSDDFVYRFRSATYSSLTNQVVLGLEAASLENPWFSPGSRYRVVAQGSDPAAGLRDLAGNRLEGGQDFSAVFSLHREPELSAIAPLRIGEGNRAELATILTHYNLDGDYRASISWGDGASDEVVLGGTFPTERLQAAHRYADDGLYSVTLTVFDRQQVAASISSKVTVENDAPTLTPRSDLKSVEGSERRFTLADFTDPGFSDGIAGTRESFTAAVDWGDGTQPQIVTVDALNGSSGIATSGQISLVHTYEKYGTYFPQLTLRDDDGGVSSIALRVSVDNVMPVVQVPSQIVGNEGELVALGLFATDAGSVPLLATVHWGDGTSSQHLGALADGRWLFDARHAYADDGLYTVNAQVSDSRDGVFVSSAAQIASVAPTVAALPLLARAGELLTVDTIRVSDPGFTFGNRLETFSATIDWGDGTPITNASVIDYTAGAAGRPTTANLQAQHTYAAAGLFQVTVIATDDDGAVSSTAFAVGVSQVQSACFPRLDFERSATGHPLAPGTIVSQQWAAWGIHVSSHDPVHHPPMIIHSAKSMGKDFDLDSPEAGHGAPSQGDGRTTRSPAANSESLQNVLVVSQGVNAYHDEDEDEDAAGGGSLIFSMDHPTDIDEIRVFDIDRDQTATFRWFNVQGALEATQTLRGIGHRDHRSDSPGIGRGLQTATLNARAVGRLEIVFSGSGALAEVIFCRSWNSAGEVRVVGSAGATEASAYVLQLDSQGLAVDNWLVNWGDGTTQSVGGATQQLQHIYLDGDSDFSIYATAAIGPSVMLAPQFDVKVANVIPKLTITGQPTVNSSQPYVLNLGAQDPGEDTLLGWVVDWGDGTRESFAGQLAQVSHTYASLGNYFVVAHAFDEDYDGPSVNTTAGSELKIIARGSKGGEVAELWVDDRMVNRFATTTVLQTFTYRSSQPLAPSQIKIRFRGDEYNPLVGLDRNLIVDCIVLNGRVLQTEAGDVYSSGTWLPEDGVQPGYRRSEWLHTNGYFQFDHDLNDGSRIEIVARGDEVGERFDLLIEGRVVRSYTTTTDFQSFRYRSGSIVTADQIRVQFTNDSFNTTKNSDRNLVVDYLKLDGSTYQTEHPSVYSTGTWKHSEGIRAGYRQSEWLHAKGYFQFSPLGATGSPFDTAWVSNELNVSVADIAHECLPTIDFEYSASGVPLRSGDRITNQFAVIGMAVTTGNSQRPAMIFNTAAPTGGDTDLGTPNAYYGGPGVGSGGRPGAGANSQSQRNVLIISEDNNSRYPNDSASGGKLIFMFIAPQSIEEVHLLDIDSNGSFVKLFDAQGALLKSVAIPNRGNNSFQVVALNATHIARMEIVLSGSGALAAIVSRRGEPPIPPAPTTFFVVDTNDQAYRYAANGASMGQFALTAPVNARGAATTGEGNPMWVVSEEGTLDRVYVYDTHRNSLLGSWKPLGVTKPEGLASDGVHVWIVDDHSNRVVRYNDAANRRSGSLPIASDFLLAYGNQNPTDITTDGNLIWVVDSGCDCVFVYDMQGKCINWWRLDSANAEPTGLTVKPGSDQIYVLDSADRRVYVYPQKRLQHFGGQSAASSFALAPGNTNPQGIADPGSHIAIGDTVSDTMAAGEVFDWTFDVANSGTLPENLFVQFLDLTGAGVFTPVVSSLIAPDGNVVYIKSGWRSDQLNSGVLTGLRSGTYTLRVFTPANVALQFKLWNVPTASAVPIHFGEIHDGALETPGSQDHWSFTGVAGTSVYLDVLSIDTVAGGDLRLSIVSPAGQIVSVRSFTREFGLDQRVLLPMNGTYTIIAQAEFDGAQTPTYRFQLWEIPPDDIADIAFRETVSGFIQIPGAVDQWEFHATAGQEIFLDFLTVSGGELDFRLTAPDGSLLLSKGFSRPSGLDAEVMLRQTGNYTLTTQASFGASALIHYSFVVWDVPPEVPQLTTLNVPLSGSIVPGQRRVYQFDVAASTEILVDAIETNGRALGVSLVSPSGVVLAARTTVDQILLLDEVGTYSAFVETASSDVLNFGNYGAYAFRLQDASSPEVGGIDSVGTRFAVGFSRNLRELLKDDTPSFSLSITSPIDTSGTVQIPGLQWYSAFDVDAGQTTTIALPGEVENYDGDMIQNRGIIVTALDEVAVYGLNQMVDSTDGFTAIPVDAIGSQYVVMSYPNTVGLLFGGGTSLTVVAAADNTLVTITPAVTVGSRVAGVPYSFILNKAQSYTLHHDTPTPLLADLTGTRIESSQPISVFGGSTAAVVPRGFPAADHMIEQLPPVSAWGKVFLTQSLATRTGGDTFRVLAQHNNTQVFINNTLASTLDAGQVFETILTTASILRTSNPSLVAQFSNSSSFDGMDGDPFMMLVPPFEQFQSEYTLSTPSAGIDVNFANLIVPNSALSSVRHNGVAIPTALFSPIGDSGFAGAAIPVAIGSHHFQADAALGVSVYGFSSFESYGYFGGMALAPIPQIQSLSVTPREVALPVAAQHVVTAAVTDGSGQGVRGVRVQFTVTGSNPTSFYTFTDAAGVATFRYAGQTGGEDTIKVTAAGLTQTSTALWNSVPPSIDVQSPAPGSEMPTGRYVLVGQARAGTPTSFIAEVLVEGRHVEALDAEGQFFYSFELASGARRLVITAIDNLGHQATTTLALTGLAPASGSFDVSNSRDLSGLTGVRFSQTTFHRQHNELYTAMRLSNLGSDPLDATLAARFESLDPATVYLVSPDALDSSDQPLLLFDSEIPSGGLLPGQSTAELDLRFSNQRGDRFAPEVTLLAPANSAPHFTSAPLLQVTAGRAYTYHAQAIDPEGARVTYALRSSPPGMTIDPTSGRLDWLSSEAEVGRFDIAISVVDGRGGESQQSYSLAVLATAANRPPVISSSPIVSSPVNAAYVYAVAARDLEGDSLTYAIRSEAANLRIDAATGLITAPALASGTYSLEVTVSDSRGGVARQDYTLSVGLIGSAVPTIVSIPPVVAYQSSLYSYAVTVEDASQTELAFTLEQSPLGLGIDPSTGRMTWHPSAAQLGSYAVIVQVRNGLGRVALQSYTLQVIATRPNQTPRFASSPPRIGSVNQLYTYAASATDPDGQALTYALALAPAGMTIDSQSGLIQWTPSANAVGATPVTIVAQDPQGKLAVQAFRVDVRGLNRPPVFASAPLTSVEVGTPYRYNAQAIDNDDGVAYTLNAGPLGASGMQIDRRSGAITWQPGLSDVGNQTITVRATDDRGLFADQTFTLAVAPDTRPPTVSILADKTSLTVGGNVQIRIVAADNVAVVGRQLTINGSPYSLDRDGRANFTANQFGIFMVAAAALDATGNIGSATLGLRVVDPSDTSPPVIRIQAPSSGQTITYLTDIIGSVTDAALGSYSLEYSVFGLDQWQTLVDVQCAENAPACLLPESSVLGTLDPTLLERDVYTLRVIAEDLGGNIASVHWDVSVLGQAVLGNLSLDFVDLQIPLAGIPITISRSYDTLDANRSRDFGFGWSLGLANANIRESVHVSDAERAGAGIFGANPFRVGSRVYLTNPEGRRVGFTFSPIPEAGLLGTIWHPRFTPDPGVYDRLEVDDVTLGQRADGTFTVYLLGFNYNPSQYALITKDQHRFLYDQFDGLQSVTDRNDVSLTYTDSGIFSSLGPAISWTRDNLGRITEIFDPSGNSLNYQYSPAGDLVSVRDQVGNVTSMTYQSRPSHYLQTITDARGIQVMSLSYDDAGRLTGQGDSQGNSTRQSYDLANNTEVIADLLGNSSTLVFDGRGNITSVTDSRAFAVGFQYDASDNPIARTDAKGNTTLYEYDLQGNLTKLTEADGSTTRTTYDSQNNIRSIVKPSGHSVQLNYDAQGNLVRFVNAIGGVTETQRDASGRATRVIDPNGHATVYEYMQFAEPTKISFPDGTQSLMSRDPDGRVTKNTDALGNVTVFQYDAIGRIVRRTNTLGHEQAYSYDGPTLTKTLDALGRETRYSFDKSNRLIESIDALGGVTQYDYDANGRRTKLTDPLGRVSVWTYQSDLLVAFTDPSFAQTTYAYDGNQNLISEVRANGATTRYIYDALNRIVGVVDPLGGTNAFTLDSADNVLTWTDPRGHTTSSHYDALNRITSQTDPLGNQELWSYDALDNALAHTDARGFTTTRVYDPRGRLITQSNAQGGVLSFAYNASGNLVAATDELGFATKFAYDSEGQQVMRIDPLDGATKFTYDPVGNRVRSVDANGNATVEVYDALNRRVAAIDALMGEEDWQFDAVGNLRMYSNENGHAWRYAYDDRNKLTSVKDPENGSVEYAYDRVGNMILERDEAFQETVYTYDLLNRLQATRDPQNAVWRREYDASGNLIRETDPLGMVSQHFYDSSDRLTRSLDRNGAQTEFQYDAAGNQTRVIDAVGNPSTFVFDSLNRLSRDVDAAGAARVYQYDAVGNLISSVDRNGRTRAYEYDALRRKTNEQWLDGNSRSVHSANFTFDAMGNLLTASDASSAYRFTYDALHRQVSTSNVGSPLGTPILSLTFQYDSVGNRTAVSDSQGAAIAVAYNSRGLVGQVNWRFGNAESARMDFDFDARGNLTQVDRFKSIDAQQLASSTQYAFDSAGRLIDILNRDGQQKTTSRFSYGVDALGRVTQQTINGVISTLGYDFRGQLTTADHASQADERFSYDANGNRNAAGTVIGRDNRLLEDARYAYSYDGEGNLVRRDSKADGNYALYFFDHGNRLVAATEHAANGLVLNQVTFTYDVFNRRIAKSVDVDGAGPAVAATRYTLYDGDHAWADYDAFGVMEARYLYGPGADELLARWTPGDPAVPGNGLNWYLTDRLGSVRDLLDAAGGLLDRVEYDSFGQVVSESAPAWGDRFKYAARELDTETGLYYYRARYYSADTGRFISRDPLGLAAGDANPYRYVGNDPYGQVDPSGMVAVASYAMTTNLSRYFVASANAFAGYTLGYSCGYIEAHTTLGLACDAAEFYAQRAGMLAGSLDFGIGLTLGSGGGGTAGSTAFALIVGGLGAATTLSDIAESSGPDRIIKAGCLAINVAGGLASARALRGLTDAFFGSPAGTRFLGNVASFLADESGSLRIRLSGVRGEIVGNAFDRAGMLPRFGTRTILDQGPHMTCGPTSCGMILEDIVGGRGLTNIAGYFGVGPMGIPINALLPILENNGVKAAFVSRLTINKLMEATSGGSPAIVAIKTRLGGHAIVVDGVTRRLGRDVVAIRDPRGTQYFQTVEEFRKVFLRQGILTGR